jgi:YVTN family beta-propeller protein
LSTKKESKSIFTKFTNEVIPESNNQLNENYFIISKGTLMKRTLFQMLLFIALCYSTAQFVFAQSVLPIVLDTIAVGGSGGMDCITCDPKMHRLYISHSSRVEVVQYDTKEHVGSIEKTSGVHGIALAPEFSRGFTSNGKSDNVTVFDLKTLAVIGTIDVGKKPDAIIYEPVTKRIFTFNGESENCSVIDAATMKVVGTLALGGGPEAAVADRKGDIFVNIETTNEVVRFNAASLKISSRSPISPAQTPTGISMDREKRILFIGGRNQIFVVMNADDGKIIANFPIGKGVDGTAFDSKTGMIYVSNKDGSLDVIHEDSLSQFTLVGKLQTSPGAKTLALDSKAHHVFLPTSRQVDGLGGMKGEMMVLVVGRK